MLITLYVVLAIVLVLAVAALLLWGVHRLMERIVRGEKTPIPSSSSSSSSSSSASPLSAVRKEGFVVSLNPMGQVIDNASSCTVWNSTSTAAYTFSTPGIATHPMSSPANPKCVVNLEGGNTSLLSQGAPVCNAQSSMANWTNPLIPSGGGFVTKLGNEIVNSMNQCVIELDPNRFDSYAAFDYSVANAATALTSGVVSLTSTLNTTTSELSTSVNQLVALTQSISATQKNVQQLTAQIQSQGAANSNLQGALDTQISATQGQENDELSSLNATIMSLQTSIAASNAYLSQLKSTLVADDATLTDLTSQYSQEQDALQRQQANAKASAAIVPLSQVKYISAPPAPSPTVAAAAPPAAPATSTTTSCYGAKDQDNCVTCDDVVNAYMQKGWGYDKTKFAQCASQVPAPPPAPAPAPTPSTTTFGLQPMSGSYAAIPSQGQWAHGSTIVGYSTSQVFPNTSADACYWKNSALNGSGYITNDFIQGQNDNDANNTCTVVFH